MSNVNLQTAFFVKLRPMDTVSFQCYLADQGMQSLVTE